jgi:glycosyltransferase involved in cell wall biosynthesis
VRILITANHLAPAGGLERTQLTNCSGLARRGHRLDLVYVQGGEFQNAWRGITESMTRVPSTLPRRAHPFRSSLEVARARTRLRQLEADVIYVYRYWDLPFAVAAAHGRRTAVVYHLCLPPPEPVPHWMRTVLARVDSTVSVASHTLGLWEGTGLDTGSARVAMTGVDLQRYAPGGAGARAGVRSELGLAPDDFVVLFTGRLAPEKGIDVLIDAFGQLSASTPGCHLVILGSPPQDANKEDGDAYVGRLRAAAKGLPVTWLPHRSDVVPILQGADVAVVPSRWAEPLSRAILEPLACGVPVVATRVGGSPEILTGWLSEFLVPSENPAALAARLRSLSDWRRREPDLGERCRQSAEARLSLDDELNVVEGAMFEAVRAVSEGRGRSHRMGLRGR